MTASDIVHARLDRETREILERLRKSTGLRDSTLIRRALRSLDAGVGQPTRLRITGVGAFESKTPDLGSDPEHLRGFGGKPASSAVRPRRRK